MQITRPLLALALFLAGCAASPAEDSGSSDAAESAGADTASDRFHR